jgi:2,4-dienoyl-CoA reductase-like NADH-dependent reductase (Old Yellow Enzyme family)
MVREDEGGWSEVLAPSAVAFAENYPRPREMTRDDIANLTQAFAAAAQRALAAGFRVIEIHAAHGYLIHEFLSPLSNQRRDDYGGSFENRTRLARDIATAIRRVWPEELPLFTRISATDWVEGGWDVEQSIELARQLKTLGVDLVDCSTGGNVPSVKIPVGPGYQTAFAERLRRDANILTAAVGMITSATQAEHIVGSGQADAVIMARELLRDPYFPMRAARELGQEITWPAQYLRAGPHGVKARVPIT